MLLSVGCHAQSINWRDNKNKNDSLQLLNPNVKTSQGFFYSEVKFKRIWFAYDFGIWPNTCMDESGRIQKAIDSARLLPGKTLLYFDNPYKKIGNPFNLKLPDIDTVMWWYCLAERIHFDYTKGRVDDWIEFRCENFLGYGFFVDTCKPCEIKKPF